MFLGIWGEKIEAQVHRLCFAQYIRVWRAFLFSQTCGEKACLHFQKLGVYFHCFKPFLDPCESDKYKRMICILDADLTLFFLPSYFVPVVNLEKISSLTQPEGACVKLGSRPNTQPAPLAPLSPSPRETLRLHGPAGRGLSESPLAERAPSRRGDATPEPSNVARSSHKTYKKISSRFTSQLQLLLLLELDRLLQPSLPGCRFTVSIYPFT